LAIIDLHGKQKVCMRNRQKLLEISQKIV